MTEFNEQEFEKNIARALELAQEFIVKVNTTENSSYEEDIRLFDKINSQMVEETGYKMLFPSLTACLGLAIGAIFQHQDNVTHLIYNSVYATAGGSYDESTAPVRFILEDEECTMAISNLVAFSKIFPLLESFTDNIKNNLKSRDLDVCLTGEPKDLLKALLSAIKKGE